MEPKGFYDYFKVVFENISVWPVFALIVPIWLSRNAQLIERITKFKVGGIEFELEKLKQGLEESKEKIETLENDINRERQAFLDVFESSGNISLSGDLSEVRRRLKAQSKVVDNFQAVQAMLRSGATPEEIFAAAVVLRENPDPKFLSDITACLDRVADSANLLGLRLIIVWTLVSAVHKMLLVESRLSDAQRRPAATLKKAREVLLKLDRHPMIQSDRPENPSKGIRGPIKYSLSWIDKLLASHPGPV